MKGKFHWIAAKLTVFTLVTIVVTVWLASVIGNFQFFSNTYSISAEFSDATGLLRGDLVKAAGVTVGRVDAIEIDQGKALVEMRIREEVQLPAGLRAEVRFRNLVGQRMITLVAEEPTEELTEPGELIPLERTSPAFDLTQLFNGLRPLIRSTNPADVNIVTAALTEALQGRGREVEALLSNVADVSDVLSSRDRELEVLLRDLTVVTDELAGRDRQLRSTLSDLNSFLADISAGRDDLAVALQTLDDASVRLRRIVARNDANIKVEIDSLAILLDAIDDKRADLRGALRALPDMLLAVERSNNYGEWTMFHLVDVCRDDLGTCGTRGTP